MKKSKLAELPENLICLETKPMKKDFDNIRDFYNQLKSSRAEHESLWEDISNFTSLVVHPSNYNGDRPNVDRQVDEYIDDPTSAISVFQSGDYLNGIVWGVGGEAFELEPSDTVLDNASREELSPWFKWVTKRVLQHLNHPESGLSSALKAYFYDQQAFGTSGIGIFENPDFKRGVAEHALICRGYGVDNIAIDEGKNGLIEYVFVVYRWRTNRIVNEFAVKNGVVDSGLLAKLPQSVRQAYEKNEINTEFQVVHGIYPREDFNPRLKGKRGAKYVGVWFLDSKDNDIFAEEDYRTMPIAVCRQIKVRGEVYGRSAGTILLSSIKTVNYMVGQVMEILEKMNEPGLAIENNALLGDSVLDSSSGSLTVLNSGATSGSKNPIFPLYDVGDPTGIINYLIPYLNSKIATAFKIDLLIDFNNQQQMTAAESTQRYIIRGQALAGTLSQQMTEMVFVVARRAISLLLDMGLLGVDPSNDAAVRAMSEAGRADRIIPQAVMDAIKGGYQWFVVKPNERMRKMLQTEKMESLMQFANGIMMLAQMNPAILGAVDFYKLLSDWAFELGVDVSYLIGAAEFEALQMQQQQMQAQMMLLQQMQVGATAGKDVAQARKLTNESNK